MGERLDTAAAARRTHRGHGWWCATATGVSLTALGLTLLSRAIVPPSATLVVAGAVFAAVAALVAFLGRSLHVARRRAEAEAREAAILARRLEWQATEACALADELAAQRRFLRQVIDTIPSFVFAKDRGGRYTLVNRALADAYGTTPEAMVGRSDADFNAHAEEVAAFRRDDLAVIESGRALHVAEEPITDTSGAVRLLQTVKLPLRTAGAEEGPADQVLGVATDVTERRRLEAQLRHAQRMEAVGQLAGGVAHDFNNLLTVIKSFGELLLQDLPADSAQHADVREITTAADRAAALTRQLLAFSRKQVLRPEVLNINGVVSGVTAMLARLIGPAIRCDAVLDPALATVRADPGQVEQVILNLAVNARDAMPDGGCLTIETRNVLLDAEAAARHAAPEPVLPGPYVLLSVRDSGVGMDAATLARVFEPFFTTKPAGQGTGLGLATVYGIVRQSGGHVTIESARGVGTTVCVYLPQHAEADRPGGAAARSARAARPGGRARVPA